MKRILYILFLIPTLLSGANNFDNIIPHPLEIKSDKGHFNIAKASIKCESSMDKQSVSAVKRFASKLSIASGITSNVSTPAGLKESVEANAAKGLIFLTDKSLQEEEYTINIDNKCTVVRTNGLNGVIYALQTIMQLLPESIYGNSLDDSVKYTIPCGYIHDKPRFAYRGMHIDPCRHFWEVKDVKRYIDVMSFFKLNRLHWHLSDDQGWRIEIKALPLLTQIGQYRHGTMIGKDFNSNDGVRYGGFYTQEEIKDVINYASARGITIIPEIDLPGHMLAALSAYPEMGCTGGPYTAWTKWGVSDQVLCVGKEATFDFLETVLTEVAELFPSEYIHIGGDECPKTEWENCPDCQAKMAELGLKADGKYSAEQQLQAYVTKRIENFLKTKGKKIIGWDEILEGDISQTATIMSWRGMGGAKEASAKGMNCILTPNSHFYFDYCQSKNQDEEPLSIGGYVSLEKVYSFDPFEGITDTQYIMGVQANLWTEYISTTDHLFYMLLPRLLALSEVQWCEVRDYQRFTNALETHGYLLLDKAKYNYRRK